SGKGGIDKSTLAINLALAIASFRHRVGILDADIFGPSIPRLLNIKVEPQTNEQGNLIPLVNYGVKAMSMGFIIGEDSPVVWRGLMENDESTSAITSSGIVIVSTPQDIALVDARKGAN
ncbi:5252_t:CDS:2, partial [Scutellospora calospora]